LPKISGDLTLSVFSHRSLRPGIIEPTNDDWGGNDRLAILGESVLEMAITSCLFSQKPMLSAADISKQREGFWSEENLENLVSAYKLLDKLCRDPALPTKSVQNPEEFRLLLNTYFGAVHFESGPSAVQEWVNRLLNPNEPPPQASPPHPAFSHNSPFGSPAPPSSPPPPLPPNSFAGVQSLGNIARLNELATRTGMVVVYEPTSIGPAHQPTWTVKCKVNGVEAGQGMGKNQKLAKEDAAKQAIYQLSKDYQPGGSKPV